MDIHAIRQALSEAGESAGYTAFPYTPEDAKKFPAWIVNPPDVIEYGETLAIAKVTLTVTVCFSASDLKTAQERMDAAMSTEGSAKFQVRTALNGLIDPSWAMLRVKSMAHPRLFEQGAARVLACDFVVEVHTLKRTTR